jgi:hypothetical protein
MSYTIERRQVYFRNHKTIQFLRRKKKIGKSKVKKIKIKQFHENDYFS